MARIISNLSSMAAEFRTESKGDDKSASRTEGESRVETEKPDRWETATAVGKGFLDSASESKGRLMDAKPSVTRAVAGPVHDGATEAMGRMTEWFDPGEKFLDSVKETRIGVQTKVRQEVERYHPDNVRAALEHAASPVSDLKERIEQRIDRIQSDIPVARDALELMAEDLEHLEVKGRAAVADRVNRVLNGVADVTAKELLKYRDGLEKTGGVLQEISEFGAGSRVENVLLDALGPPAHTANVGARWAISAMGRGVEGTVEMAEFFSETPGLPTKGNFDEWVQQIEPGESLVLEGEFLVGGAVKLGGRVGAGAAVEIARAEDDPNRMTLTVFRQVEGSALLGKDVQEQGGSVGVGGRGDVALQFDFDMRRPEQRELMAELVLANQLSLRPSRLMDRAEDHLTRATVGAEAFVDAGIGPEFFDVSAESGYRGEFEMVRRADGPTYRLSAGMSGEFSFGSFVQMPKGMMEELIASMSDDDAEMAAEFLSEVSGGKIGTGVEVEAELMAGMEIRDRRVQALFVEGQLQGETFGLNREVTMELAIHDVEPLAEAMGISAHDLSQGVIQGDFSLEDLYEAAQDAGDSASEVFGVKVTDTSVDSDGYGLDVLGVELGATIESKNENILLEMGTPIDTSPVSLDELGDPPTTQGDPQMRLMDAHLQG